MKWSRILRNGLLCCLAAAFVTSCGSPTQVVADRSPRASAAPAKECTVRTDSDPIKKRFPQFGEPKRSHWCSIVLGKGDSRVPGPTDVRLVGVVEVTPEVMEKISGADPSGFAPARPEDVPSPISEAFPEIREGKWVESARFDESVTRGLYTAGFCLNRSAHLILVDSVNPAPADVRVVTG